MQAILALKSNPLLLKKLSVLLHKPDMSRVGRELLVSDRLQDVLLFLVVFFDVVVVLALAVMCRPFPTLVGDPVKCPGRGAVGRLLIR